METGLRHGVRRSAPLNRRLAKSRRLPQPIPVHIPDGFLDAKACVGTFCMAGAGLGWATRRVRALWSDRTVPLIGVMSAFLFAGQMVNFPIAGGTSGHLLGGVLAATLLGPEAAVLALTTVLVVQCLLFQDGGVTALGANILNMALVGTVGGYLVYRAFRRLVPGPRGLVLSAGAAAWCSVVLAAAACSLELAAAGTIRLAVVLPAMVLTHAVIGLGEALITGAVVAFMLKVRPDLVHPLASPTAPGASERSLRPLVRYALLFSLGIAIFLAPLASSLPDGLMSIAARFDVPSRAAEWRAAFAGYTLPWVNTQWLGTSLAAALGTVVTFALAWVVTRRLRRPRSHLDGK
jgi:cobalt/nickel transport system permease protein